MNDAKSRVAALPCFKAPRDIQALDGGITNVNLSLWDGDTRYVVRLGSDIEEHGVMRWNELALSQAAEKAGVSPSVVYHAPGVLVLQFIDGKTFGEADIRDAANLPRIIDLVAQAHRGIGSYLHGPVLTFWPYQVVRTYAAQLGAENASYMGALDQLMVQAQELEAATGPVELVIGHNDLLAANILDDGQRLWLIDWEYGGFNSPLFDLAGLAGNNGLTESQEVAMLEQYFDAPAASRWRPYQAMKCISLMRETLWSMTSEIHSTLEFNYAAYTAENLARFQSALEDFRNT